MGKDRLKVLFIHNSVPEYRIEFWKILNKYIDLTILVTRHDLDKKIYGLEKNTDALRILYFDSNFCIKKEIYNYDVFIMPPIDSVLEYKIALRFKKELIKANKEYIYWSEKWEPDKKLQPMLKRIKNFIQKKMIYSVAKNAKYCIASGTQTKKYFMTMPIDENIIQIAYDSSTSPKVNYIYDIRKKYGIENKKIILYFGRIVERKGLKLLIEASKDILEKYNSVLLICGDGDNIDAYKKLAKSYPIYFIGKIQPSIRRLFYEQSDIFVLPSFTYKGVCEAWGLTVNEAIECGIPVISTSAVGSAYDLLNDGTAGIMIEENNIDILKNELIKFLSGNRSFDKENIFNKYDQYSVDKMAKAFFDVILMCVND